MIDKQTLMKLPDRIRLPPQMKFSYLGEGLDFDGFSFVVHGKWPDVRDPSRIVETYSQIKLHWCDLQIPEQALVRLIYRRIKQLWMHELYEWFTVDGENFIDPHPEGGFR